MSRHLRGLIATTFAIAAILSLAGPVAAQTPAKPTKPGVVVADVTELMATVDAIDLGKRLVTLTGPKGNKVTVKAGPAVKNLDQVKAGDTVVVQHFESIALFVRKSSDPPSATEVADVQVAPKGKKPAAVAVDTVEITATVEAIDYAKRTVTLRGPAGKTKTIKVDPSVKRFKQIKKGDEVVVRHTEALAISVQKP